jgi:hypothetical protein
MFFRREHCTIDYLMQSTMHVIKLKSTTASGVFNCVAKRSRYVEPE